MRHLYKVQRVDYNMQMGIEIERKFLVHNTWNPSLMDSSSNIIQGYLTTKENVTVRVRIIDDAAWLTLKGKQVSITRKEYNYKISTPEAQELLDLLALPGRIHKTRYSLLFNKKVWVVDVFHEGNKGLILAEIELQSEDEAFSAPGWIGTEVSLDPRYTNSYLAQHPFSSWENNLPAYKTTNLGSSAITSIHFL